MEPPRRAFNRKLHPLNRMGLVERLRFSGTLFKCTKEDEALGYHKGELVLSFRSTEFIDDAARDNEATNKLEIKEFGYAFGQIADMEAWYRELNKDPALLKGKNFSVTGYSLGGHLATAFTRMRRDEGEQSRISAVYTFNGAGVGELVQDAPGKLADLIRRFELQRKNEDGWQIEMGSVTANSYYRGVLAKDYDGTKLPTESEIDGIRLLLLAGGAGISKSNEVVQALKRVRDVMLEAYRVPNLAHKGANGPNRVLPGIDPDWGVATIDAARLPAGGGSRAAQ